MKIAVVTSRFPWPLEKGDKLRIYHQLQSLSDRHEILLLCITKEKPDSRALAEVRKVCDEVRFYSLHRIWRLLYAGWFWFNGKPAQIGYFYHPRLKKRMYDEIIRFSPDRIYCQLIRMSEYVKALPFVKVLDYMDTFSAGLKRQAGVARFPLSLFYRREARLTRFYERQVFSYFDSATIISVRDRDELPLLSKDLVQVIPNGIDTDRFTPAGGPSDDPVDVLFVGNLGYKPNEQAVLTLRQWWGEAASGLKVLIAGARPTPAITSIQEEGWEIAGWVDDIVATYQRATIFAAPLLTGTGLQNKILEAMSCGLACITTSLVNDSLGATRGRDLLIADSPQEFHRHLAHLMEYRDEAEEIGRNARTFVVNNYKWTEFNEQLDHIITHAKSKTG